MKTLPPSLPFPITLLGFLILMPVPGVQAQDHDCDQDVEHRLEELGIVLPDPPQPVANYVGAVRTGNLVFLAGAGPRRPDGSYVTGRLGEDMTLEAGFEASRLAGISLLAALKAEIGDLNRVTRIVKVFGMVNSTPDFTDHPGVINGFSDLMVAVFCDRGRHARAVAGMAALPLGFAVEIEMVVEVDTDYHSLCTYQGEHHERLGRTESRQGAGGAGGIRGRPGDGEAEA